MKGSHSLLCVLLSVNIKRGRVVVHQNVWSFEKCVNSMVIFPYIFVFQWDSTRVITVKYTNIFRVPSTSYNRVRNPQPSSAQQLSLLITAITEE